MIGNFTAGSLVVGGYLAVKNEGEPIIVPEVGSAMSAAASPPPPPRENAVLVIGAAGRTGRQAVQQDFLGSFPTLCQDKKDTNLLFDSKFGFCIQQQTYHTKRMTVAEKRVRAKINLLTLMDACPARHQESAYKSIKCHPNFRLNLIFHTFLVTFLEVWNELLHLRLYDPRGSHPCALGTLLVMLEDPSFSAIYTRSMPVQRVSSGIPPHSQRSRFRWDRKIDLADQEVNCCFHWAVQEIP
eukprot:1159715-Pelagomonas_calceolata.AAC.11